MRYWLAIVLLLVPSLAWAGIKTMPHDTFLGISPPCQSVAFAREKAIQDVVSQVLRTIGASYSLEVNSTMTGTADRVDRHMSERFSYSANGFIRDIDRNVVSENHERTPAGIVYRMRVRFTRQEIETFRRLSLGAKVHAVWAGNGLVELREVNGNPVVLTEYTVSISERNAHAGFLSYYVMKVSSGDSREYRRALSRPVHLKDGIVRVRLSVPGQHKTGLQDLVLGTRRSVRVTISGRDQVGRAVHAQVRNP